MLFVPLLSYVSSLPSVGAFDLKADSNLALYSTETTNLANYCQGTTANIIPIAFLDQFHAVGDLPSISVDDTCSTSNGVLRGTALTDCSILAEDIQACQASGKAVTLAIGGAKSGLVFANDTQGNAFAHSIWDLFLGGSRTSRPFGNVVLDGIDLDIQEGSQTGFVAFLTTLRDLMNGGNKPYLITAASQCPYPDTFVGATLNSFTFDAVFVRFYNDYCGLDHYGTAGWNFDLWDNWAKTTSSNPKVKVYIGAPASSSAATSGYVDASTLSTIIAQTKSRYTSFGGVALWDASHAYANNRYDVAVKEALTSKSLAAAVSPSSTLKKRDDPCAGVLSWKMNVAYDAGQQVTYNGHLWTARYWSYNDVPGGAAGVWHDDGFCTAPTSTNTTSTPSSTSTPSYSCSSAPRWHPNVSYSAGQQVSFRSHLWTAKQWSYNDVPGGTAGVWVDNGPCTTTTTSATSVTNTMSTTTTARTTSTASITNITSSTSSTGTTSTTSTASTASATSLTGTAPPSTSITSSTTFSTTSPTSTTIPSTSPTSKTTTTYTTTTTASSTTTRIDTVKSDDTIIAAVDEGLDNPTINPRNTEGCSGVLAWEQTVAYVRGQQASYNGRLWTAKWQTHDDVPGGTVDVWTDNGPCRGL